MFGEMLAHFDRSLFSLASLCFVFFRCSDVDRRYSQCIYGMLMSREEPHDSSSHSSVLQVIACSRV